MAKPVEEADLEIPTGKAKHAKLLARWVKQPGVDAAPVLEQCITSGSKAMRAAGWTHLVQLDLPRAERLALSLADAASSMKKKEREAAIATLLVVATAPCLNRWEELSGKEVEVPQLDGEALERASPYLAEKLSARGIDWALAVLASFHGGRPPIAFFRPLLDDRGASAEARATIAAALIKHGDLETCRRDDLTGEQRIEGAFKLPTAECFDRLAPHVRDDPATLKLLAWRLQHHCDPRWVEVYLSHGRRDPELAELGLCNLPCPEAVGPLLELAASRGWDQRLKQLLFALGRAAEPRAAPILMKWLQTEEAREGAPLLLTALNGCGRLEDIDVIEAEGKKGYAPGQFFGTTVAHIRARHERG